MYEESRPFVRKDHRNPWWHMGNAGPPCLGSEPVGASSREGPRLEKYRRSGVHVYGGLTNTADLVVCRGGGAVVLELGTAGADWCPCGNDWALIEKLDAIYTVGTIPDDIHNEVFEKAWRLGKLAFTNPTRCQRLTELNLKGVAIAQVSRADAANFGVALDAPAAAVAELFLARGCASVVVTEREYGERVFDQGGTSVWMPAVPRRMSLYPSGAGAAAMIGHIVGYLGGMTMYHWANLGCLCGAHFVEHGCTPTWDDVSRLQQQWPPEGRVPNRP